MICGKFREEMWEKKKRNLGEFLSNLCQGLMATPRPTREGAGPVYESHTPTTTIHQ